MIYAVQVISTILAVMVIAKSYADYKKRNEAFIVFIFWTIAWLGIVFFAYFPQTIDLISRKFDDSGSGLSRFLALGMTFLFFIIYRLYVKAERVERNVGRLIKELAIKEISEQKSKGKKSQSQ